MREGRPFCWGVISKILILLGGSFSDKESVTWGVKVVFKQTCERGVTGLHDSQTRVSAALITLLSQVYLLRTVLSYMILMAVP